MRKSIKTALALGSAVMMMASSVAFTSCEQINGVLESLGLMQPKHEHTWTDWKRTETDHERRCLTCEEEEHGTHSSEDMCPDCGAYFKALAFGFTSGGDSAHADFAVEANEWFAQQGEKYLFSYQHVDMSEMTEENLADCDLVILLNNSPGGAEQQEAFKAYMDNGGACMIFHSAAFAMWDDHIPPNDFADWYHNELLRSGEYGNRPYEDGSGGIYWNTWDPTSDYLYAETTDHYAMRNLPLDDNDEFLSAPCEWYAWSNDLLNDPEVTVLLTLNPTPERPAGNDPRPGMEYQIWTSGKHPIAWANNSYDMIYMNWGHNLQSYNHFEKQSKTFSCEAQCQFVLDGMFGLVVSQ